jgi:pimeloyl-ACP methyl ester carboxylesterase
MSRAPARFWSRFCCAALSAALLGGLSLCAAAQAPPAPKKPVTAAEVIAAPERRSLQTRDNTNIRITYYKANKGKESPVIVLLHMEKGNRLIWEAKNGFAEKLQASGYAVVTVDLRQHGESAGGIAAGNINQGAAPGKKAPPAKKGSPGELKPIDYKNMVEFDMEAVKKFIYDEHQAGNLNMSKMAIVGPEMGAAIATQFAAVDWLKEPHADGLPGHETPRGQDVRALVLITPQASSHGMVMAQALKVIGDPRYKVAFLFGVGKDDEKDRGQTRKLFDQAAALGGKDERVFYIEYPGKLRGTELLRVGIEKDMKTLFDDHLMKLDSPWRDRKSKLDN